MKINKSTKKIVENIIKKSEQIILKKNLNHNILNTIKKVIQKNKELLQIFLNSMMIFATIEKNIKKHFEKMKKIVTNTTILLIKELSNDQKQQDKQLQNFWKNFREVGDDKTPFAKEVNLKLLKTHLNNSKWKTKGLDLVNLLGNGFQMIESIFAKNQKTIKMAFQIGNYVGAVYLIHHLEQTLPKVLFLFDKKRKKAIWIQREQLFFLKINFVEKYNEYLRKIRPLNFNIFIRKFNYMLR